MATPVRERDIWHQEITRNLTGWDEVLIDQPDVKPVQLAQTELALRLLQRLDPQRPARDAWVLLSGYPFARAAGITVGRHEETMLTAARHRLWMLRRHRLWQQYLEIYRQLPQRLCGYRVTAGDGSFRQVVPAVASQRFEHYDAALDEIPGFATRTLKLAGAGRNILIERAGPASVTIPAELIGEPAAGHPLAVDDRDSGPLTIPREQLAATARWMDERIDGDWLDRWNNLELAVRHGDGYRDGGDLALNDLLHLVGMVGAGKSTLMILVAVWAATRGEPEGSLPLRTTLVVGDVAEQLRLVATFRSLDLRAVPVLGPTTRETHVQRLHRRLASQGERNLLLHDEVGFDDLSTVCVVDALRDEEAEPLRYAEGPCSGLYPVGPEPTDSSKGGEGPDEELGEPPSYRRKARRGRRTIPSEGRPAPLRGEPRGCPLWSRCPRHAMAREQVEAEIWVANPWTLVSTSVSAHLNRERLRQLELTCLRSDIVIVDEADRVQMTFDQIFAPSATLVTQGLSDSWLDQVQTKKIDELAQQGRLQLTNRDIAGWDAALGNVVTATNRIYAFLIKDPSLRSWVDIDYFNTWTLQEKLLAEWFPTHRTGDVSDSTPDERLLYEDDDPTDGEAFPHFLPGEEPWAKRRDEVQELLDQVRDNPLGNDTDYSGDARRLLECVNDLLHGLDEKKTTQRVSDVLDRLLQGSPCLDEQASGRFHLQDGSHRVPGAVPGSAQWRKRSVIRLSFTLLLYALERRLDLLTRLWPQVEAALHLDTTGNELSRKPPLDYAPLIPESPMGNVLGFQYLVDKFDHSTEESDPLSGTLRFFRCAGIGRELLLGLPRIGNGGGPPSQRGPRVLLMSGTSWAGTSTRAHVLAPVGAILKPSKKARAAIKQTVFRTGFLYDPDYPGKPLSLSGKLRDDRAAALKQMIRRLGDSDRPGMVSPLEEELKEITDPDRNRALLLVGSYRDAAAAAEQLHTMQRWRGRVRVLTADDAELSESSVATTEENTSVTSIRRGDLASFASDPEAQLLVAPLLAVERGHNILNEKGKAAFGTVFFLTRPHPRPDDLYLSVFAINDWACRFVRDQPDVHGGTFSGLVAAAAGLDEAGLEFRRRARTEWRRLVSRRYVYSRLEEDEKVSFAWDQLVTLWQVIGRLVRGGVPARVVFVDAAFAPGLATAQAEGRPHRRTSREPGLLPRLREVLEPYFTGRTGPEAELVRTLYEPLYEALTSLPAENQP